MGIENDRLLGAECDVAHQADFGVAAGPVQNADCRYFEVIDQRTYIDAPVFVSVLVGPVLEVSPFEGESIWINRRHEMLTRAGENQDFVLGIGADGLE